jgi:AraC family transcriptional regulator, transcriptional activator of the genes for pyochelin and ferripyochelin receptors
LIVNEQFHQDVWIETAPFNTIDCVEFGFNLSSTENNIQESFLQWTTADDLWEADVYPITAGEQSLRVDIHLHPDHLRRLLTGDHRSFGPELQQLLDGVRQDFFWEDGPLTPAMGVVLDQILHCPFSGVTEHIYLEAKCLELIALKLDQLSQGKVYEEKSSPLSYQGFQPEDIERIDRARKLLIRDLKHSPSLSVLAHQVGLNEFKLRQGFRQLYGTTVFGYLHHCRMLQAQQLLA